VKKRYQIPALDGIEVLKVYKQDLDFPEHYHDTFCISLIEEGIEAIKMGDTVIYSERNHISITNPFEVHSNPLTDKNTCNSFTTIYVSGDVVDTILENQKTNFRHQQIINVGHIELFRQVTQGVTENTPEVIERNLKPLLQGFVRESPTTQNHIKQPNSDWADLISYVEQNLEGKITLDLLAKFMHMDKFNFAKQFRKRHGLSPINYVLMRKIFKAKQLINTTTNLTQLAYQFEFSDQSHFSKYFKRFVGMPPQAYKKQLA